MRELSVGAQLAVSLVAALICATGPLLIFGALGGLSAWFDWALLVALTGTAVVGVLLRLVPPRTWVAAAIWLCLALALGVIVLPFIGYVVVYRISGATD